MEAAAQYLRVFREARGLSQEDVATRLGVASKSVYNWESGAETKASTLAAWIASVEAVSEDVVRLLNDASATQEDGRRLAQERLVRSPEQIASQFIAKSGDERARKIVERFNTDPKFRDALFTLIDPD